MQTQRSKKSKYFFQVVLDNEQLSQLIKLDSHVLKQLFTRCSKIFLKELDKNVKSVFIFLANYKRILQIHSIKYANDMSINISLHFALIYTQFLMRDNQYSEVKALLKQTANYIGLKGTDPILQSICLNNLSLIYLKNRKLKKSLTFALRAINIMQCHLEKLHIQKNKKKLIEDGIIFANLLSIAQSTLKKLIKQQRQDKQFYKTLLKTISRLGHSFSKKYFGDNSYFTSKFQIDQDSLYLPVYLEQSLSEIKQNNVFQVKISQQLQNIYKILEGINFQPQVYYIKENLIVVKQKTIIEEPQPIIVAEPQPERSVTHIQTLIIDSWHSEISILQQSSHLSDKQYSYLGHLKIKVAKGKNNFTHTIRQQSLKKILNIINVYDVLPYEMNLKNLKDTDFIRKFMINYVSVSDEGKLSVFPRAKSIINPFTITFCGQESLIFVNHIQFRRFRVGICPLNTCLTMYLELDFKNKSIYESIKFVELLQSSIDIIQKKYYSESTHKPAYSYGKYKELEIYKKQSFQSKITAILQTFQQFLKEDEDCKMQDISCDINFVDNYFYYQYTEFSQDKGQFHQIKYRSNANHIEINVKNTQKTHYLAGSMKQSQGNFIYSPQNFQRDFAVSLRSSKKFLPAFSQIIVQKFSLKIYQNKLLEQQEDLYEENAIIELPLTSKCFFRKFLEFQDYRLPITLEMVSINNEKPIGIKINAYQPIKGSSSGLFVYIISEYWEKPAQILNTVSKNENVHGEIKISKDDYNFKKDYFITKWMEQQGFHLIFSKLTIANRCLEMKEINTKFIKLNQIIDMK